MTHQEFEALAGRIDAKFAGNSRALRLRVLLWAILGYIGLLWWFCVVLTLAAFMWWVGIAAEVVAFNVFALVLAAWGIGSTVSTLWVRIAPPVGRELRAQEVPALFKELMDLQQKCRAPKVDRVYLVPELNAAVQEVPRLGPLGVWRKRLLLGLPLLDLLSLQELRAVIAHELAHVSRADARVGHWTYRLRRGWETFIIQYLARPKAADEVSLRDVTRKFLNWFWPRFNARALVLCRTAEYGADAQAAAIAGAENLGSALVRTAVYSRQVEEKFWPGIWQEAKDSSQPPGDVMDRISCFFSTGADEFQPIFSKCLMEVTTNTDTHPCLKQRLAALGVEDILRNKFSTLVPSGRAAGALLGAAQDSLRSELSSIWKQESSTAWQLRHQLGISLQHRIEQLQEAMPSRERDADSLWDKAHTTLQLHGEKAALPLIKEVLEAHPAHALANFSMGRILLSEDDPEGEELLERAISKDETLLPASCDLLFDFYRRRGDTAQLNALRARLDEYDVRFEAGQKERQSVSASDALLPHGLAEAELKAVQRILGEVEDLRGAWLARKKLTYFPEKKLFLLCVEVGNRWVLTVEDLEQEAIGFLLGRIELPGQALIFALRGEQRRLGKKIKKFPGSSILKR